MAAWSCGQCPAGLITSGFFENGIGLCIQVSVVDCPDCYTVGTEVEDRTLLHLFVGEGLSTRE
jgi:hypothetical protein